MHANRRGSEHSRTRRRSLVSLTSTAKNMNERELIQPYPATQIHSSLCTQSAARGRAPSCQTPPYTTTQNSNPRGGAGTAVSSNLTKVQRRVHSISRERAGERAQPCETPQQCTILNQLDLNRNQRKRRCRRIEFSVMFRFVL